MPLALCAGDHGRAIVGLVLCGNRARGIRRCVGLHSWPWLTQIGPESQLPLDGLGFLFALLIQGIGYSGSFSYRPYLTCQARSDGPFFRLFLLLFMGRDARCSALGNML